MPINQVMSIEAVNSQAEALAALANNGYIRIYDGTQPATADTAVSSQVLLAELRLADPAFSDPIAGVMNTTTITPDNDAKATGIASWCRFLAEDETPLFDGSVGLLNSLLIINSVSIQQHAVVSISNYEHAIPRS